MGDEVTLSGTVSSFVTGAVVAGLFYGAEKLIGKGVNFIKDKVSSSAKTASSQFSSNAQQQLPQNTKTGGMRKFQKDNGTAHFSKHGDDIMEVLGKDTYTYKEYLQDANYIINNGVYSEKANAYAYFMGSSGRHGAAKYGFVGLDRFTGDIKTFHIKDIGNLYKQAPDLGIFY